MKPLARSLLTVVASLLLPTAVSAEVVVVMDAAAEVGLLTRNQVINIFLGRHRQLPSGIAAQPVDQPVSASLRAEFYRKLVDKDLSEINAYWARLHFSGKTTAPLQAATAAEVLHHVIGKPGGIAYIERNQIDARLRIVLALPQ